MFFPTQTPWLARTEPRPNARLRLFCLPYAGGGAYLYRAWAANLPDTVQVCPIELPGRGTRRHEPACTDLTALETQLAEALRPYLDLPFAFFGHSMGGLIAFALTRVLRGRYDLEPLCLFISGRSAPCFREQRRSDLPDPDFLAEIRRLNGTPTEILNNPELMALMLPLLRADFALCECPCDGREQPLAAPIDVFGGADDIHADRAHLEAWRDYTSGECTVRILPGDHFFMHTAQDLLLRAIEARLTPFVHLARAQVAVCNEPPMN